MTHRVRKSLAHADCACLACRLWPHLHAGVVAEVGQDRVDAFALAEALAELAGRIVREAPGDLHEMLLDRVVGALNKGTAGGRPNA